MEETVKISFFSHPLFSCFITLYTLTFIFFRLQILLSPVLLISGFLLLSLLRLGTTQEPNNQPVKNVNHEEDGESKVLVSKEPERELDSDSYTKQDSMGDFVEWNLRAPLEVIYEEGYDDEEEDENPSVSCEKDPTRLREIERFPSLSLCYPESDSESDSASSSEFNFPEIGDWISPEKMGYRWEEEDEDGIEGGGLIEIKLEESKKMRNYEMDFHAEEEGLIEIDLFH